MVCLPPFPVVSLGLTFALTAACRSPKASHHLDLSTERSTLVPLGVGGVVGQRCLSDLLVRTVLIESQIEVVFKGPPIDFRSAATCQLSSKSLILVEVLLQLEQLRKDGQLHVEPWIGHYAL